MLDLSYLQSIDYQYVIDFIKSISEEQLKIILCVAFTIIAVLMTSCLCCCKKPKQSKINNSKKSTPKQKKQKKVVDPYKNMKMMCTFCNTCIDNVDYWPAHVNGRKHKTNTDETSIDACIRWVPKETEEEKKSNILKNEMLIKEKEDRIRLLTSSDDWNTKSKIKTPFSNSNFCFMQGSRNILKGMIMYNSLIKRSKEAGYINCADTYINQAEHNKLMGKSYKVNKTTKGPISSTIYLGHGIDENGLLIEERIVEKYNSNINGLIRILMEKNIIKKSPYSVTLEKVIPGQYTVPSIEGSSHDLILIPLGCTSFLTMSSHLEYIGEDIFKGDISMPIMNGSALYLPASVNTSVERVFSNVDKEFTLITLRC